MFSHWPSTRARGQARVACIEVDSCFFRGPWRLAPACPGRPVAPWTAHIHRAGGGGGGGLFPFLGCLVQEIISSRDPSV